RIGVGSDLQRRHQHRAGTDESAVADLGSPLVRAVIVDGHRACAHVDFATDGRIAEVRQVIRLAAGADFALLHFDEVADMYVFVEHAFRAQACERADGVPRTDHRTVDYAVRVQFGVRLDTTVAQVAVGPDTHA